MARRYLPWWVSTGTALVGVNLLLRWVSTLVDTLLLDLPASGRHYPIIAWCWWVSTLVDTLSASSSVVRVNDHLPRGAIKSNQVPGRQHPKHATDGTDINNRCISQFFGDAFQQRFNYAGF